MSAAVQQCSDDARRISDELTMHAVAGSYGWAVFALADGRPMNHTAYPTWAEAVAGARWDRDRYAFIEIQPDGTSAREAEAALKYARTLNTLGYCVPSPDSAESASVGELASISGSLAQPYDRRRMARQLASGRPLVPDGYAMSNLPSELPPERIPAAFRKAR